MNRRTALLMPIALLAVIAAGCQALRGPAPLRVGMVADLPPMAYERAGALTGLEPDLARQVAAQLGRPLEVWKMPWERLIPALLEGKIDAVMSGMTITPARLVRVQFAPSYLRSGLMPVVRRRAAGAYPDRDALLSSDALVGFRLDTTAEMFARTNFSRVVKSGYAKADDAAFDLKRNRLDVYLTDAAAAAWMVSENEADLRLLPFLLTREDIAWAVRPGDPLAGELAAALDAMKQDGSLDATLRRWLPFLDQLREATAAKP